MNCGVVEIGLRHRNRCLLLLRLRNGLGNGCLRGGHCRIRGVGIRFRQVKLLLAHHALFSQPRGPFVICFGLHRRGLRFFQIGLGRNQIGLGIGQISFGLQQCAFKQGRIDLGHDLSFFYSRIEIGIEARNSSRDLRTYLDGGHGIDRSRGFHYFANVAAIHLAGEILWLFIALELKGSEDSYGYHHQTGDQPMAFEHVHDIILA